MGRYSVGRGARVRGTGRAPPACCPASIITSSWSAAPSDCAMDAGAPAIRTVAHLHGVRMRAACVVRAQVLATLAVCPPTSIALFLVCVTVPLIRCNRLKGKEGVKREHPKPS